MPDTGSPTTLMDRAKMEFPIFKSLNTGYKYNPLGGKGYLEFWPPGEPGTPDQPRPKEFGMDQHGVEVYDPTTRPIDIMGDIASHHLVNTDPVMKNYYAQFQQSMTDDQKRMMQSQYQHARENFGESRPYAQWEQTSGLPAYFRGHAFEQWNDPDMYTPEQRTMFGGMMKYLRGQQ